MLGPALDAGCAAAIGSASTRLPSCGMFVSPLSHLPFRSLHSTSTFLTLVIPILDCLPVSSCCDCSLPFPCSAFIAELVFDRHFKLPHTIVAILYYLLDGMPLLLGLPTIHAYGTHVPIESDQKSAMDIVLLSGIYKFYSPYKLPCPHQWSMYTCRAFNLAFKFFVLVLFCPSMD